MATRMPEADFQAQVFEKLAAIEHGRQALVDALWARIPAYVTEKLYQASATQLVLNAQTTQLEVISNVIATVPAGATANIQLGDTIIPVGQGLTSFSCQLLLGTQDTRSLVLAAGDAAGPMTLVLMGEVAPTFGQLH